MCHCRYKKDKDGYYRLLTVRYESVDIREPVVAGLAERSPSQVYSPGVAATTDPSVVIDLKETSVGDAAVPMSNLELLGNVAFAMSRSDGSDNGTVQPVVLSTNAGGLALTENNGSHVVYIVHAGDGVDAQSFEAVLQQTVESSEESETVRDGGCTQSISGITNNTPSLYFTDSYDTLCGVGPIQSSTRYAVSSRSDRNDNIINCMQDQLAASEPSMASGNTVGTTDSDFFHGIDTALDSFSLSLLTNAATS